MASEVRKGDQVDGDSDALAAFVTVTPAGTGPAGDDGGGVGAAKAGHDSDAGGDQEAGAKADGDDKTAAAACQGRPNASRIAAPSCTASCCDSLSKPQRWATALVTVLFLGTLAGVSTDVIFNDADMTKAIANALSELVKQGQQDNTGASMGIVGGALVLSALVCCGACFGMIKCCERNAVKHRGAGTTALGSVPQSGELDVEAAGVDGEGAYSVLGGSMNLEGVDDKQSGCLQRLFGQRREKEIGAESMLEMSGSARPGDSKPSA